MSDDMAIMELVHGRLQKVTVAKIHIWLTRKLAAEKLSVSEDTVDRRGIPWQEEHVPHKLRYKLLKLNAEGEEGRRYFEPDCEALMINPPKLMQPGKRRPFKRREE